MVPQLKTFMVMIVAMILAGVVQAGYVDLFRDAYFKDKLMRVNGIVVDACYMLSCQGSDDVISSAKWRGLPEKGDGVDPVVTFFTGKKCNGENASWPINTQTRDDLYFPENFRLDGINDAISSFRVVNRKNPFQPINRAATVTKTSGVVYLVAIDIKQNKCEQPGRYLDY